MTRPAASRSRSVSSDAPVSAYTQPIQAGPSCRWSASSTARCFSAPRSSTTASTTASGESSRLTVAGSFREAPGVRLTHPRSASAFTGPAVQPTAAQSASVMRLRIADCGLRIHWLADLPDLLIC